MLITYDVFKPALPSVGAILTIYLAPGPLRLFKLTLPSPGAIHCKSLFLVSFDLFKLTLPFGAILLQEICFHPDHSNSRPSAGTIRFPASVIRYISHSNSRPSPGAIHRYWCMKSARLSFKLALLLRERYIYFQYFNIYLCIQTRAPTTGAIHLSLVF